MDNNKLEKFQGLLDSLKEELKAYELIDEDTHVHYNLITTDTCYSICKKYMEQVLRNG